MLRASLVLVPSLLLAGGSPPARAAQILARKTTYRASGALVRHKLLRTVLTTGRPGFYQSCQTGRPSTGGEPAGTEDAIPVTVSYIPTGTPRTLTVAGTFNAWNKGAIHLARQPNTLAWAANLRLAPGVYQYKFIVNDTRWLTPQDAPRMDDGNGNINALLAVAPEDFARRPAASGDGQITATGVIHHVASETPQTTVRGVRYVTRPDRAHVDLVLRTRHNDVQSCLLIIPDAATAGGKLRTPMSLLASDALFDFWRVRVALPPVPRSLRYAFALRDGQAERLYDSAESLWTPPHTPKWFELKPLDFPPFETPDWARDAIFYQIFPDRFANGDKSNDPPDVRPWESAPTFSNRMGGDLAGVLDHLEYLRELGINGLYFNPIFQSRSNHGYDTTDYKQVDTRFGTTANLKAITARAHLHGWHVILDGVFNHSGVDFAPFQSLIREGVRSPYRRWYYVRRFPIVVKDGQDNYEGWNGTPWLPKLNVSNPPTRDYLLDVGTYWMREAGIDGWRLDAANEVGHDFWKAFRKRIKSVKSDAYVLGEIWPDASDWLQGDEMDSVMNYRWRGAVLDFFIFDKTSPAQFDAALARIRSDYPPAATAVMFNMLGSHDVERIRTLCRGDWTKERQAVAFQMTYPGAPCIYYGDEVGMEGGKDPDDRRAMPWDKARWDKTTLDFYKAAIKLRNEHPVLRRGDYRTISMDGGTGAYAFLRTYKSERALVVFNRSDAAQRIVAPIAKIGHLPLHTWLDTASKTERQGDNLVISLPPRGLAVLGR